jgi:hypothetical protein
MRFGRPPALAELPEPVKAALAVRLWDLRLPLGEPRTMALRPVIVSLLAL